MKVQHQMCESLCMYDMQVHLSARGGGGLLIF